MADRSDHLLAADLATRAGRVLLDVRDRLGAAGASTQELKDTGDRQAHDLLMQLIGEARPDDAVLSEEGKDDKARLAAQRVWIIDPLDGTREFSEPPRADWAVHVALVENATPTVGAVALPGLDLTLSTAEPPPTPESRVDRPRVICSRTRPGPAAEAIVAALEGELLHMGSAGAKTMAVVRGEADVYAHTGGQYEWDSCAPVAVAAAAGLHVSRLDGSPLRYNQDDVYLPDLLVCHQALVDAVLAVVGR